MKTLLILLTLVFVGCGKDNPDSNIKEETTFLYQDGSFFVNEISFTVIVVDGCEYLGANLNYTSITVTHKGNCTNCARIRKEENK